MCSSVLLAVGVLAGFDSEAHSCCNLVHCRRLLCVLRAQEACLRRGVRMELHSPLGLATLLREIIQTGIILLLT
jgi:hypothetical protein